MMEKEYIERQAVLNEQMEICHWDGLNDSYDDFVAVKDILAIPAADVVEVRHGKWLPHTEYAKFGLYQNGWRCSLCNRTESYRQPYCHCGAKMDGKGEE